MEEIVALEQLVGEFGERHAVAALAVEASLDGVLCHHVVDGNAFTDFACEVKEGVVLHPVVVVHQFCRIRGIAFEVEETAELFLDACHIVAQGLLVEEVAFLAFPRGVANHSGCTSYQCQGFVSCTLQVAEHHHATEVADMERIGGRVNAHIGRYHAFVKEFFCSGHHLVEHTAPFQFFYKIHILVFFCCNRGMFCQKMFICGCKCTYFSFILNTLSWKLCTFAQSFTRICCLEVTNLFQLPHLRARGFVFMFT